MSVLWPDMLGPDSCEVKSMARKSSHKLKIYIATELVKSVAGDPQIAKDARGKRVAGLISFAIPDYSIIFRCRIICPKRALTATAAVTALRFLETTLSGLKVDAVEILTDSPEFYFEADGKLSRASGASGASEASGVSNSSNATGKSNRQKILKEYRKKYKLTFGIVEKVNNPARTNSADVSCAPSDITPPLVFNASDWSSLGKVLPLQGGIEM